ncbi:MAG: glycosyltransferase family 2 protein [Ardenticatenia bacterium]|nr:glycosyltransferase family 2 protein [Ardenticatenia bacterium]
MRISVVIPVWNGATIITECLEALFKHSGSDLYEVICVDNASADESASLIGTSFPQVRLLHEPVNLGFAGGVNAGIKAAEGDVYILLNQDCIVQPGWIAPILQVLESSPGVIIGCLLLNQDGTVDHAGATIQHPECIGVHLTEVGDGNPRPVEYVSGAAFALHRRVWEAVGRFDEGFYPAYYEDADYCLRARRHGIETLCVPQARVVHLRSSKEWQVAPLRYWANYHSARYRFACKHLHGHELHQFFEAEVTYIEAGCPLEEALTRIIAVRRTLFRLPEIIMRRKSDLGEEVSPVFVRQIQVGLGTVLQEALAQLESVTLQPLQKLLASYQDLQSSRQQDQQQEYHLLQRFYFRSPLDQNVEPWPRRIFRLFVLRLISFLIGRDYLLLAERDYLLLAELNTLHTARMDRMAQIMDQIIQTVNRINYRIKLLETVIRYDEM